MAGSKKGPIWDHFHEVEGTNTKHSRASCRACVKNTLKHPPAEWHETQLPADLSPEARKARLERAIEHVGTVNGVAPSMAAHILGYTGHPPCPHATDGAKTDSKDAAPPAKKPRNGSFFVISAKDSEYGPAEEAAIRKQACRAIVSSGAAFALFEDTEVKKLFDMVRVGTSDILPSGKAASGSLLNECARDVEEDLQRVFGGREIGIADDGWKGQKNNSVNGVSGNVDFKSYPLELIDATALAKDGPAQCKQFAEIIDAIEKKYNCRVVYFITDADGGALKGPHQFQLILGDYFKAWDYAQEIAERATAIIIWIRNHSKVRVLFDEAQKDLGRTVPLAYLMACITRWTTHFTALARLFLLKEPIMKTVAWKQKDIVSAQVGAAKSTEKLRLENDANHHCAIVNDQQFWSGLEQVLGDIEVVCYATNLAQKDSTRADQALLGLVGVYLRFSEHPEATVKAEMVKRIEKRWSTYDQSFFLLVLVLNPWEQLSCFSDGANLDHFKVVDLAVQMYRRLALRPNSNATPEAERMISRAMGDYLAGIGCFQSWNDHIRDGDSFTVDEERCPITFWKAYLKTDARELACMSMTLFSVVIIEKMEKTLKVHAQIRTEHRKDGVIKDRKVRQNHKDVPKLLAIPRYGNLLQDQDDEDPTERGRALIRSPEGWRVEMAKWISAAREAAAEDSEEDTIVAGPEEPEVVTPERLRRPRKWQPMTLERLFGKGVKLSLRTRVSRRAQEEEEIYMQVMAELDAEDDTPDDGAIEIDDDEVWGH
ncbi:hypothetical protein GGX14DRAFT_573671 [Mycena pura]|uniref:DUF659 domain-containing protein n=1 Tax=Mycena pura TaxID=153505 RepID=A0AAD6UYQ4_9AGAR|nr:hypothetical protein GGX14DRAFT_573671 [Mycena pura]